ncbi:hypothetical protein [Microbacterium sp. G2-8]|uniref:hypothetical protein n=1 Tax=Microbacterium sp. G2-8 TaxID=2842454 RepID=UPI001C89AE3C|nr:hypothetical protein [Microbacterium sp. G2-8]
MTDLHGIDALRTRPLTHDRDLTALVNALLPTACTRRLWVMLLDDEMRSTDVLMPIDDIPKDPTQIAAMPASGPVTVAQTLGQQIARIVQQTPVAYAVVVWERTGSALVDAVDREWIAGMRQGFASNASALRAQFVLSDDGAEIIADEVRVHQAA